MSNDAYWAGGLPGPNFWPGAGGAPTPITAASADFQRERYYEALFFRLCGLKEGGLVVIAERKVRLLDDMAEAELPALFMAVGNQGMKYSYNNGPTHSLDANVYLYCANPDRNISADAALNGLLDAVQASIKPPVGLAEQTLDGIVHSCRMGDAKGIDIFAGVDGTRAAAIVPIVMEVPQ